MNCYPHFIAVVLCCPFDSSSLEFCEHYYYKKRYIFKYLLMDVGGVVLGMFQQCVVCRPLDCLTRFQHRSAPSIHQDIPDWTPGLRCKYSIRRRTVFHIVCRNLRVVRVTSFRLKNNCQNYHHHQHNSNNNPPRHGDARESFWVELSRTELCQMFAWVQFLTIFKKKITFLISTMLVVIVYFCVTPFGISCIQSFTLYRTFT